MRLNILVFAAGVLAVQFLPDLPSRAFWLGGVAAAALLTGAALFPGGAGGAYCLPSQHCSPALRGR